MNQRVYFQTIPLDKILIENSSYTSTYHLKRRLIREDILKNQCAICGLSQWRDQDLSLHLDHINGVSHDNRLENLRLLCPNCHSQTETYCARKNRVQNYCLDCHKTINRRALRCKRCNIRQRGTKIKWPPSQELQRRVEQTSYLAVARELKVSDNALRKRLARHPEE